MLIVQALKSPHLQTDDRGGRVVEIAIGTLVRAVVPST
jgi:hypothetical protein